MRQLASALVCAFVVASVVPCAAQQQAPTAPTGSVPPSLPQRALLDTYCVTCHNQELRTAGLTLDTLDVAQIAERADIWENVARKLRAREMPPAGRPRPDPPAYDDFRRWVEAELDAAAAAAPNPGRTEPFHRLNRAEYQNAVRDLLAFDLDVAGDLPADDASYGFDNMAGVLRMSPTLMERYLVAAAKISRGAVGTAVLFPGADTFRVPEDLPQDDRLDNLPFGSRGGTLVRYHFPVDGEYLIRVSLMRQINGSEAIPPFDEPQDLEVSVDGQRLKVFTLPPETAENKARRRRAGLYPPNRRDLDENWQVRFATQAGARDIRVTFLNRTPDLLETLVAPYLAPYPGDGTTYYTTRQGAYLWSVDVRGPFEAGGAGDTISRRRIFVCRPKSAAQEDELACATTILSTLARRAYRRPVRDPDLAVLLDFYRRGRSDGGFEAGIERAIRRLLVSPAFLFRIERDPPDVEPDAPYRITDLELASRLSFFLWSSIPDDELLELAEANELSDPAVLEHQVRRMLVDERAAALVDNFAGQWLFLRNIPGVRPIPRKDPDFDDSLRQAFRRETELFFESIVRDDRSVLDLLRADYTFVNERLARHYGIPNVHGPRFRRVTVTDENRRGLLGHGSILAVTSYPNRTSAVLRGKWIMDNILGTPPPDPPPNVPELEENRALGETASMRERMAQHRANPACASCHARMDPLGLALENFDLVGRWRTFDESGNAIDASGTMPNGTHFSGPAELRTALLEHPDRFVTAVAEKLLTYALGRGLEHYDGPAVRAIVRDAARHDNRFASSLILGVVKSRPFQMRRAAPQAVAHAEGRPRP